MAQQPSPSESEAKRRLLFTLGSSKGPEERRIPLFLLEHLSPDRFELHLALWGDEEQGPSQLPQHVGLHDLGSERGRQAERSLRTLIEGLQPQVLFSPCFELSSMLLRQRRRLPGDVRIVVREASAKNLAAEPRGARWFGSRRSRRLYRGADRVICPYDFVLEELQLRFGIPRDRIVTIYDPLDLHALRERARAGANPFAARGLGPHVLVASAITGSPDFDQLVHGLPGLAREFPGGQLWIIGDDASPQQARALELRALAGELGVEERLHLVGPQEDPERWLHHADLCVLPAEEQETPGVLVRALACGCPVIAFESHEATHELMERSGQLERLVSELEWRREWFRAGPGHEIEADMSAFDAVRVVAAYEEIFLSA
jgi:glycosyltransferase involved in cell wall biosynthesis